MEDLDFTKPLQSPVYDPDAALAFFRSAGADESVARGETFFVEHQKHRGLFHKDDKMYLLLEGEVRLVIGQSVIDTIKPGEIFGEMDAISEMPRSMTAVAKTACRAISMRMSRFHEALSRTPEFALMLMSIMIDRLRLADARLDVDHLSPVAAGWHEGRVVEKAVLAELLREAGNLAPLRFMPRQPIMTAGERGFYMYVVLEGSVAISVRGKVVEKVGPGSVFGEMALIDHSSRAASATAETNCALLPISRNDFLALVKTQPSFGEALLKTIADRLRFMMSHIPSN